MRPGTTPIRGTRLECFARCLTGRTRVPSFEGTRSFWLNFPPQLQVERTNQRIIFLMNAYLANLINAIALVVLGAWGYAGSEDPSVTALLVCSPGVKKEDKIISHVAVVLTVLILFGLIKPLTGAIGREDTAAMLRVIAMMVTTVVALVFFVRSFIAARKKREG